MAALVAFVLQRGDLSPPRGPASFEVGGPLWCCELTTLRVTDCTAAALGHPDALQVPTAEGYLRSKGGGRFTGCRETSAGAVGFMTRQDPTLISGIDSFRE